MKFSFWALMTAVVMVFGYTYHMDNGYTPYQVGYEYVTGELPALDLVTKTDKASLNNLISQSSRLLE